MLSLALGIGATTTMYSVIDAVDLRPLPYRQSDRLLLFGEIDSVRRALRPLLGREFSPAGTVSGAEPVAMVSYDFWRGRLGADRNVLGQELARRAPNLEVSQRTRVIGVLSRDFHFGASTPIWVPVVRTTARIQCDVPVIVVGRLRNGITPATAGAELATIERSPARRSTPWVPAPTPRTTNSTTSSPTSFWRSLLPSGAVPPFASGQEPTASSPQPRAALVFSNVEQPL